MSDLIGYIHSIETLGATDGPGIRMVIFFQGCPLRCVFCHNPDTWEPGGKPYQADALIQKALRYKKYFGKKGGLTLSGGEPLLQAPFAKELLQKAKESGIHTAIETAGFKLTSSVKETLKATDLVILDLKGLDANSYKKTAAGSFELILKFLDHLLQINKKTWLRYVVMPGINDTFADMDKLLKLVAPYLLIIERIELLPYHRMGLKKYEELNIPYPISSVPDMPKDKLRILQAYLDSK